MRELTATLIKAGIDPADAAALVARAMVEIAPPAAAAKPGAARMADYRDRREAMGLPRTFPADQYRPSLIARDGARCIYCEATGSLVIDHIHPLFLGGDDGLGNLGFACRPCNGRKAGRTLDEHGMAIAVESARRAHEDYKSRTVFTPAVRELSSPEPRTSAHNHAQVHYRENSPLSSLLTSDEKKHSEKKEKREANRGCRLPETWMPLLADFEAAVALLGHQRADAELAKFRDHWKAQPGSKGVKTDWLATWRNWYRRAVEYGGRNVNGTGSHRADQQSGTTAILAGVAEAADRRARSRAIPGHAWENADGAAGGADTDFFGAQHD